MEMNRENFFDFLWANYSEIIGEGYAEKPTEYTNLFSVMSSDSAYEKYREVVGLPVWEENYEGNPINLAERNLGYEITIYNKRFDQGFKVTWEYFSDNKEKLMGGYGINDEPRMLGRGCRVKQEMTAAKVINDGFTAVGYDGVPLFSTAHPIIAGGTCSNTPATIAASALTFDNLTTAITAAGKQVDHAGIKIQTKPNKLFVALDLYFTALRLVNSSLVAGTQLNDVNPIGMVAPLTIVPMSYFDDGIWVLKDDSITNLIFLWREEPIFDYERIQGTYDYKVFGLARWGVGYRDWRGLYGAKVGGTPAHNPTTGG